MNKNTNHQILKGKGFYAVLAVIIAGAAFASYLAINSMMTDISKQNKNAQEDKQWGFEDTQVEKKQDNIKQPSSQSSLQNTVPSPSVQSNSQKAQAESSKPQEPQMPSYALPMSGAVIANFSADELVFNTTMNDWRTHNGTDISAAAGTEVKASMGATVTKAYYDDMWGGVVELSDGTVTVRVMGLTDKMRVQEGNTVVQGAVIGNLGENAAESALESHLHIEVEQNGALINPETLLK